jgi:hypothetical protein
MRKITWIFIGFCMVMWSACGNPSKPFTEGEKKSQDSIDLLNQNAAFDDLLKEDNESDSLDPK